MGEAFDLEKHLNAILGGQPYAVLRIIRDYGPSLRTFLGAQLFHLHVLDGLAQEAFIVAYERLPAFTRSENFGLPLTKRRAADDRGNGGFGIGRAQPGGLSSR